MKRNGGIKSVLAFLFVLAFLLILDTEAVAATPTWEELQGFSGTQKMTKVYKEMDVTGDKKIDTVKVVYTPKGNVMDADYVDGEIKILVNGKRVYKEARKSGPYWNVRLIRLKNGKAFFYISSSVGSGDNAYIGLYQYKSGKLREVYDLDQFMKGAGDDAPGFQILNVTGNKIVFQGIAQFNLTGMLYYKMTLVHKNGKLKLASSQMPTTGRIGVESTSQGANIWTSNYTIKAYKKVGSKKLAYKVKKGTKISIKKVIYKNKKFYFQVKELNGKKRTGYIPNPKGSKYPYYFVESMYVG